LPAGASEGRLVWVMPVPATPELANMDVHIAQSLFLRLGWDTRPNIVSVGPPVLMFLLFALWVASAACLLIILLARKARLALAIQGFAQRRRSVWILVILLLAILTVVVFALPASGSIRGLDMVDVPTVRVYDVRVIKGQDGGEVVTWLKENGFVWTPADETALGEYASIGWSFVVAMLETDAKSASSSVISTGLTEPLVIRFDAAEAVYPAVAATGMELALYVLAEHKMDCGGRLRMSAATGQYSVAPASWHVRPQGFFDAASGRARYLTRFRGMSNPGEARQGIVLRQAADDAAFRESLWAAW